MRPIALRTHGETPEALPVAVNNADAPEGPKVQRNGARKRPDDRGGEAQEAMEGRDAQEATGCLFPSSLVLLETNATAGGKREDEGVWMVERGAGINGQDVPRWVPLTRHKGYKPKEKVEAAPQPVEPATEAEKTFFHSGWAPRRSKVSGVLARGGFPCNRTERFNECGASAWVYVNKKTGDAQVRANFCRDRFCQRCAAQRGRKIKASLISLMEETRSATMELTLKRSPAPLAVTIARLVSCFKRMREDDRWTKYVRGGAWALEIKRSEDGKGWHPHLHIVWHGPKFPQRDLADLWEEYTGDSRIVWLRFVGSNERAAGYVTKYVTKPMDSSCYKKDEWLQEAMFATRGMRSVSTFGDWRGVPLEAEEELFDKDDWKPLTRLEDVLAQAANGQAWAQGILRNLYGDPDTSSFENDSGETS